MNTRVWNENTPCPKCGGKLYRKEHKQGWNPRPDQPYYFSYWYTCKACRANCMVESAKVKTACAVGDAPIQKPNPGWIRRQEDIANGYGSWRKVKNLGWCIEVHGQHDEPGDVVPVRKSDGTVAEHTLGARIKHMPHTFRVGPKVKRRLPLTPAGEPYCVNQ